MSSAEQGSAQYIYAGWVPTANGSLSFRHIGESRHPTESIYANVLTGHARLLIAYQRRPLSDVLFQSIIHYLFDYSGSFYFAITATMPNGANDAKEFNGIIYIFKSKEDWKTKARSSVRSAIAGINNLRQSLDSERDTRMEEMHARASGVLSATADIMLDFKMRRTGEVYFGSPVFLDPALEYASASYAENYSQDFGKWIADQCYFFLRDLSHHHQHHGVFEDTILILQRLDPQDTDWRTKIVYSLHHYMIRSKRSDRPAHLIRSLGILAYCQSFEEVCRRTLGKALFAQTPFNVDSLSKSINARIIEQQTDREIQAQRTALTVARSGNNRVYALTIAAMVFATLAIFVPPRIAANGQAGKYPVLDAISVWSAENLVPIIALTILGTMFWFVFKSERVLGWRDVLEASNVVRKLSTFIYFGLGLAIFFAAAYFGSSATAQMSEAIGSLTSIVWDLIS